MKKNEKRYKIERQFDYIQIEKNYLKAWRYFLSFYRKTPIKSLLIIFVALISSAISIAIPFLTQGLKDATSNSNLNLFITISISMISIYLIKIICDFINEYIGNVFDFKMEIEWRNKLLEKLFNLPMIDFDNRPLGDHISRIVNDLKDILNFAFQFLSNTTYIIFVMAGGFTYAFLTNWFVGLLPLVIVLISIICYIACVRKFVITKHITKGLNSRVIWKTEENVKLISEIKSYAINDLMLENYELLQDRYLIVNKKASFQASIFKIIGIATNVITSSLIIIISSYGNLKGTISDSHLIGLTSATTLLVLPLINLSSFFNDIVKISPTLSRLYFWVNIPEEKRHGGLRPKIYGKIEFRNVDFSYKLANGRNVNVLNNFSMKINANEYLNLYGLSGSGKTTIFKLLLRFYEIDKGQILIDDIDIRDIDLTYLRNSISYIASKPKLFSELFDKNEFYEGNKKYYDILKRLDIVDLFERKRQIDENLNSQNILLSEGEMQMLSFARAMYFDNQIILLDNIENCLNENQIFKINLMLSELRSNKTIIIATSNRKNCFNSLKQLEL